RKQIINLKLYVIMNTKNYFLRLKTVMLLLCINIGNAQCWQEISKGLNHTVAIKADGTLWSWGHNGYAQLGTNGNENANIPHQIGLDSDWVKISSGQHFTLGIKEDGTLWAWGANHYGELGYEET